jgi:hypothetical protein
VERRDEVRDHVLRRAEEDERIVAAAAVGSLAGGEGDRWSDLDLTFGVAEEASVAEVMESWTRELLTRFGETHLLDVASGDLVYRVFLFHDWLQVDLSFAPRATRKLGPAFAPIFGAHETKAVAPREARDQFAWAALYARHAFVAIERGQPWHAAHCVGLVREEALALACRRRDLPTRYAKGVDHLPLVLRDRAEGALVRSLDPDELRRALGNAVALLLEDECAGDFPDVGRQLATLT